MPDHKPYLPSNGTEGDIFEAEFCNRCQREAKYRQTQEGEDGCDIHARAIWCKPDEPEYPAEWIQDGDDFTSGRCTAFVLEGARAITVCKGQLKIDGSAEPGNRTVFAVKVKP